MSSRSVEYVRGGRGADLAVAPSPQDAAELVAVRGDVVDVPDDLDTLGRLGVGFVGGHTRRKNALGRGDALQEDGPRAGGDGEGRRGRRETKHAGGYASGRDART